MPLDDLARIARELGADDIARDAKDVAARTAKNRFYVACVGQFKRGKSTLINAIVGEDLLPAGVVPVTAVITIVRYGAAERMVVRFLNGEERAIDRSAIADFVAEERNPRNEKKVRAIEIETPSAALASGMCLVDTPGVGSIFETNSETTRRFVPHVDAALVVVGADPPIAGEEASLVADIAQHVPDVLFVMNKADRPPDRDVELAADFTRAAVERQLQRSVRLFVVSAIEPGTRDWNDLLDALARLPAAELVAGARDRAARRIRTALQHEIEEHRRALVAPIEETEARLANTLVRVGEAQRALDDLTFLFASEQQKLSREMSRKRERLLAGAPSAAEDESAAHRVAAETIEMWSREIEADAQRMFGSSTARFATILRDLGGPEPERQLARSRFYFTSLSELTGRLFHKSSPPAYLRHLLETNSARLINDVIDRFVESRRLLERDVALSLGEIASAAERAAQHARAALGEGREKAAAELELLVKLSRDASSV